VPHPLLHTKVNFESSVNPFTEWEVIKAFSRNHFKNTEKSRLSPFSKVFEFSYVSHLHSKDTHISATLKGKRVHTTSLPTGTTKNIWSADPRRNASLSSQTQGVRDFFFNQEELIILAEMGLFAELELKIFFVCVCVCVLCACACVRACVY